MRLGPSLGKDSKTVELLTEPTDGELLRCFLALDGTSIMSLEPLDSENQLRPGRS